MSSPFAALRDAVTRRATALGRTLSPLPGVVFFRADGPFGWAAGQAVAPTMGVVVQGRKQARVCARTPPPPCAAWPATTTTVAACARRWPSCVGTPTPG